MLVLRRPPCGGSTSTRSWRCVGPCCRSTDTDVNPRGDVPANPVRRLVQSAPSANRPPGRGLSGIRDTVEVGNAVRESPSSWIGGASTGRVPAVRAPSGGAQGHRRSLPALGDDAVPALPRSTVESRSRGPGSPVRRLATVITGELAVAVAWAVRASAGGRTGITLGFRFGRVYVPAKRPPPPEQAAHWTIISDRGMHVSCPPS